MLCLRTILALLLALQVINPMCCCTVRADDNPPCGEATPAPTPSCCSRTTDTDAGNPGDQGANKDDPSPGEQHQCLCASKQKYTQDAKTTIPCPQDTTLPEPVVIKLLPLTVGHPQSPSLPKVEHHPPGPPLRLRYSIFRL